MEPKYTHKGWFVLCPIKIAEPYSGAPALAARWPWLEFWFDANEVFQHAQIWLLSALNPDYEPQFMFKVTGELRG